MTSFTSAFQTDSTRVISLWIGSQDRTGIDGVNIAHHDASHHGQEPTKLEQLSLIEEAEVKAFGEFLTKLKESTEAEGTLLERTTVFYASNLGNSSSHDNTNLPILLAGGGYKHAGHVAFDRKNNTYLSNLFLRILHQMDIEAKSFGASTGVVSKCEVGKQCGLVGWCAVYRPRPSCVPRNSTRPRAMIPARPVLALFGQDNSQLSTIETQRCFHSGQCDAREGEFRNVHLGAWLQLRPHLLGQIRGIRLRGELQPDSLLSRVVQHRPGAGVFGEPKLSHLCH